MGPADTSDQSQVFEFRLEDALLSSNPDFQTIEVEASVPLELGDVVDLINEGFFGGGDGGGEGGGDPVVRIDLAK